MYNYICSPEVRILHRKQELRPYYSLGYKLGLKRVETQNINPFKPIENKPKFFKPVRYYSLGLSFEPIWV